MTKELYYKGLSTKINYTFFKIRLLYNCYRRNSIYPYFYFIIVKDETVFLHTFINHALLLYALYELCSCMLYSYIICHFFTFACCIHAITNFLNTKTTGTLSFLMPCKQVIVLKFLIVLYSSNKFHLIVLFLQVKTKQFSLRILGAQVSQRILFWWLVIRN